MQWMARNAAILAGMMGLTTGTLAENRSLSSIIHYLIDPKATMKGMTKVGELPSEFQQSLRIPAWTLGTAAFSGAAANSMNGQCGCAE